MSKQLKKSKCKHCEFIEKTFYEINNNYEYWLMTEVFVYLHNGKDYCDKHKGEIKL